MAGIELPQAYNLLVVSALTGDIPVAVNAGMVSSPPPPAIESINPASVATRKGAPSDGGETISKLLNVSIRSHAYPVAPGRKATAEAISSSQILLFLVLEV